MEEEERTALVRVTPSVAGPFAISEAWYTSETYVRAARADIESLLLLFSQQWSDPANQDSVLNESMQTAPSQGDGDNMTKEPSSKRAISRKSRGSDRKGPSAFAVFKSCWIRRGWDKIHIAIVDSSLKSVWFRTMTRLLIERLFRSRPDDLKKAGALLALYTLWASQPSSIPQERILVDLNLLDLINSLPQALAEFVDASLPEQPNDALRASDDLFMAVHLMHHGPLGTAFVVAPQQAVRHPILPSNRIREVPIVESIPDRGTPSSIRPTKRRRPSAASVGASRRPATPDGDLVMPSTYHESMHGYEPDLDSAEASEWLPAASAATGNLPSEPGAPAPVSLPAIDGHDVRSQAEGPRAHAELQRGGSAWAIDAPASTRLTQEELNELLLRSMQSPTDPVSKERLAEAEEVDESAMQEDGEHLLHHDDLVASRGPASATHEASDYLNFGEG